MKTKLLLLAILPLFWSTPGFAELINLKQDYNTHAKNTCSNITAFNNRSIDSQLVIRGNSSTVSASNGLRNSDNTAKTKANRNDVKNVDLSEPSSIELIGIGFAIIALAKLRKSFSFSERMKVAVSHIKSHFFKENYVHSIKKI